MTGQIDIQAPATLTVIAGIGSLFPPDGITVADPNASGRLSVQISAGNAAARLSVGSSSGATVSSSGDMLSLSGTAAQVNAALATLQLTEPAGMSSDMLTLSASDPAALSAQTDIRVAVAPATGPAFVAPPHTLSVLPNVLTPVPLLLADPVASALNQMGLGASETMNVTLAVDSGILFLPGYSPASGIAASGLGSGTVELSFTAQDLPAVNALLATLEFVGEGPGEVLDYTARDVSGVLPPALTYGTIALNIQGQIGFNQTVASGAQTLLMGGESLVGSLAVDGLVEAFGSVTAGALALAADADLLAQGDLALSGTSFDFGTLSADGLALGGALAVDAGASLGGLLSLGSGALLDFAGQLVGDGAEGEDFDQAVSLATGAELLGNGTLVAGNFSESGAILGAGTLAVGTGGTLLVEAGSIGGGANLAVAAGGVMELGPIPPLFGVFDATPLTLDNSVTLSFEGDAGAAAATGGYAEPLGGDGGAIVFDGSPDFSVTLAGAQAGDRLIFAALSNLSIASESAGSFEVTGLDGAGATDHYWFHGAVPAGVTLAVSADAQGDPEIVLAPAAAEILSASGSFAASAGVAQPLQGLSLLLPAATTQRLSLTLSVAHGVLRAGSIGPAAQITLSASGIGALNAELAALSYTGTGLPDVLTLASSSGVLNGLLDTLAINGGVLGLPGNGAAGTLFSEAQAALFTPQAGLPVVSAPLAAGEIIASGDTAFADVVQADGLSGTALLVDGGASAIFDASAQVVLGGGVTLGDLLGSGTLAIETDDVSVSGNVVLAGAGLGAGSALDVLGGLSMSGSLAVGGIGAAQAAVDGTLTAAGVSIGSAGTLLAYGSASAQLGTVSAAGTILLEGTAQAQAAAMQISGGLTVAGRAVLSLAAGLNDSGGSITIGGDGLLTAASLSQSGGTLSDAGVISAANVSLTNDTLTLSGGTLAAASVQLQGATLAGHGVINGGSLVNDGIILAQGGTLLLGGSVQNGGAVEVAASAALDIAGSMSGGAPVAFMGADAVITLNDPARGFVGVTGMQGTDAIDLVGVAPGQVSYSGGEIEIQTGGTVTSFGLAAAGQPGVSIASDGAGGALITLGDELPCFARGTRLLTPHGYVPVEALKPGDPLITASGMRRPARWIGRRTLDLGPGAARSALPVRVLPGAFGPGLPARPLRLSPLHCVYIQGVLVPVTHLVNGATILREAKAAAMTYYHVELDRHDILLAEGLPCESYFDSGNRGALYQETGRRSPAPRPFAPNVTRGARLAAVRRQLHEIALDAGFSLTYWPMLRAVAGGRTLTPEMARDGQRRIARFALPGPVRTVTLLSTVVSSADTDPESEDRRELGVCLAPDDGLRLGQGFHPRAAGDAGVWMGRVARLHLAEPRAELTLSLAAVMQSWVRPAVDARAGGG